MTKFLQTVLGEHSVLFTDKIKNLENATLNKGIDIALTVSINQATNNKLKQLQLDPSDTTAEELFHSLQVKATTDDLLLQKAFSITETDSSAIMMNKIASKLKHIAKQQCVWAIKKATLKKVFSELPPNKTMKALHFRSIASVLKRESVAELYTVVHLVESDTYLQKLHARLKKLSLHDFEEVALELICLSDTRWKQIAAASKKKVAPVVLFAEVASILILPVNIQQKRCLTLLATALIAEKLQECRVKAAYIKVKTLDASFHEHIHHAAHSQHIPLTTIQGSTVSWQHLYKLHSKLKEAPLHYGPHMTYEDLRWLHIEDILLQIEPKLTFWQGSHVLAHVDKEALVVSLHVLDVTFACMYNHNVSSAHNQFMKQCLREELFGIYLEQPPFRRIVEECSYKLTDTTADVVYA